MRPALANIIFTCSALLTSGCGAYDFEIERPIDTVLIGGTDNRDPSTRSLAIDTIPPQLWSTNLSEAPAGIFMTGMTVRTLSAAPDDQEEDGLALDDLAFIDEVVFYVASESSNSALLRAPIAWFSAPGPVQSVELNVNQALNLLPYLQEGARISSELTGRIPPTDIQIQGTATLNVDVF